MYRLAVTKDAYTFIRDLQPKQYKQLVNKILSLLVDPFPNDSKPLKGYEHLYRTDIGEYRIVYRLNKESVEVLVVDKRNDNEVYRRLKNML